MRPVLFRGQDEDGNWHEGDLMHTSNGVCITNLEITFPTQLDPCGDTVRMFYQVKPETVGQFTGLTDKNGKAIFEGDIYIDSWNKYRQIKFRVKYENNTTGHGSSEKRGIFGFVIEDMPTEIQIVGNRHDNPELLK